MPIQSPRGDQFLRSLIREYQEVATYYRTMVRVLQHKLDTYAFTSESEDTVTKAIEWHRGNAADFQERADLLLRGTHRDGEQTSKDIRQTRVPWALSNDVFV
jgi:hypothetical protein